MLALAERSDNSSPLVQLAQIEMEQNDLDAAAATIAKIRNRWSEAATGDILDGQLALKRKNVPAAREHFNEALKKDPDNKIVQFWKAQLDSRTGSRHAGGQDARGPGQEPAQQGDRHGRHPDVGRPVGPGQPRAPDRQVRRRDSPLRGAEAEAARPARSAVPTAGSSSPPTSPRTSGRWPSASWPRSSTTPRTRPATTSECGARISTGSTRKTPRPWPARLRPQGQPDQCRGASSRARSST